MTFSDWIRKTRTSVRERGPVDGLREGGYELYIGGLRRLNKFYPGTTNVYDREWDVLLVLDACRVDVIDEVADEYPFLNRPDELVSVGSSSIEWLENTFTERRRDEMKRTAYVTGNPFSHRVLDDDSLRKLDEVWRYEWDDEAGTIPGRPITDRAISTKRELDPDRLIVHYMQPHFPSIPDPLGGGMNAETLGEGAGWEDPWDRLRKGELTRERVWRSYRDNLRYILGEVELLLGSVDAERVVVTADHGNAAGELGVYGHPKVPIPSIRRVPWYETSAEDTGEYDPKQDTERSARDEGTVEEKLSALGYL
ncbi:hydrolase [Halopelagius fulvigenes]|uniref:Hydrolase n=1 Tax=Halopelagius fulvigenes TaxID=1198324 RepID=A0ABD5U1A8_9EURY